MDKDILSNICLKFGQVIYLNVSPEIAYKRTDMARSEGLIHNDENLSDFYTDVGQILLEWFDAQDKANGE